MTTSSSSSSCGSSNVLLVSVISVSTLAAVPAVHRLLGLCIRWRGWFASSFVQIKLLACDFGVRGAARAHSIICAVLRIESVLLCAVLSCCPVFVRWLVTVPTKTLTATFVVRTLRPGKGSASQVADGAATRLIVCFVL